MGRIKRKLKKIRLHHEGTDQLLYGGIGIGLIALLLWFGIDSKIPFWIFSAIFGTVYCIVLNFFHERRIMVSIFMSLWNVHANWFPVDGTVKAVKHFNGNYHKAWLPKASEENEHADIIITTPDGREILCRQIAGAVARRIVTYAKENEECFIDEHLGFIKLGSRVDVFLPIDSEICVKMGQSTVGDQTVIARLS